MKGLILAAGRGSRLGGMTDHQPKCLTPLLERPLLSWQLQALRQAGIEEVGIVTGYCADALTGYGCPTFHNPRWQATNMVASLLAAAPWLEEHTCVVSYSDIVYPPAHVVRLRQHAGDVCITFDRQWHDLWSARFEDVLSDAETFSLDPDGRLASIGQRPSHVSEVQGQFMGLLKLTPSGFAQLRATLAALSPSERDRLDSTGLLQRLVARGAAIEAVPVDGQWLEVDRPEDLHLYEREAGRGQFAWLRA